LNLKSAKCEVSVQRRGVLRRGERTEGERSGVEGGVGTSFARVGCDVRVLKLVGGGGAGVIGAGVGRERGDYGGRERTRPTLARQHSGEITHLVLHFAPPRRGEINEKIGEVQRSGESLYGMGRRQRDASGGGEEIQAI